MHTRRQFHHLALRAAAAGLALPAAARAAEGEFPQRPVKIVVPFAAGGGPDVLARQMAARLSGALGKATVVVDNIVGAGGIVAAQSVARMAPDGHGLLLGASSHIVQKAMQPSVRFDPLKGFAPITRIGFSPSILVVAADAPHRTVDELVAAARREPGRLNYASGGVGSAAHLCAAAMALQAKIDVVHVPYKGSVDIVPSIAGGATQFAFPIASTAVPQIRAGNVRALAVTSVQRMPMLPEVPTLVEVFNSPGLALDAWFGLWAPAGTPQALIERLFNAVATAYEDPALRAASEAAGTMVALSRSPAEFGQFMQAETAKFAQIVAAAGLNVYK